MFRISTLALLLATIIAPAAEPKKADRGQPIVALRGTQATLENPLMGANPQSAWTSIAAVSDCGCSLTGDCDCARCGCQIAKATAQVKRAAAPEVATLSSLPSGTYLQETKTVDGRMYKLYTRVDDDNFVPSTPTYSQPATYSYPTYQYAPQYRGSYSGYSGGCSSGSCGR